MSFRPLFALGLVLATGVAAADTPAASAEPVGTSVPVIEVVREGDGVADVWRREGVDFPAYGPDGEPVVPSAEQQALQALANAYDVHFVSLQAREPGIVAPGDSAAPACDGDTACIDGNAVLGSVRVRNIAQFRLARETLGGWLREPGGNWSACIPQYHHALTYTSDGHAWEVLLCYGCGQYAIRRDGVPLAAADAQVRPGQREINALFAADGIRHWDAESATWVEPARP